MKRKSPHFHRNPAKSFNLCQCVRPKKKKSLYNILFVVCICRFYFLTVLTYLGIYLLPHFCPSVFTWISFLPSLCLTRPLRDILRHSWTHVPLCWPKALFVTVDTCDSVHCSVYGFFVFSCTCVWNKYEFFWDDTIFYLIFKCSLPSGVVSGILTFSISFILNDCEFICI